MNHVTKHKESLIRDIWHSFRSLPGWVQIWVAIILVPVNMASLWFVNEPMGLWGAVLANGAMLANLPVMLRDRGFSRLMAVPHLVPWTLLLVLIAIARPSLDSAYGIFLWTLFAVDLASLIFDYPDAVKWFRGDRAVAGRQ